MPKSHDRYLSSSSSPNPPTPHHLSSSAFDASFSGSTGQGSETGGGCDSQDEEMDISLETMDLNFEGDASFGASSGAGENSDHEMDVSPLPQRISSEAFSTIRASSTSIFEKRASSPSIFATSSTKPAAPLHQPKKRSSISSTASESSKRNSSSSLSSSNSNTLNSHPYGGASSKSRPRTNTVTSPASPKHNTTRSRAASSSSLTLGNLSSASSSQQSVVGLFAKGSQPQPPQQQLQQQPPLPPPNKNPLRPGLSTRPLSAPISLNADGNSFRRAMTTNNVLYMKGRGMASLMQPCSSDSEEDSSSAAENSFEGLGGGGSPLAGGRPKAVVVGSVALKRRSPLKGVFDQELTRDQENEMAKYSLKCHKDGEADGFMRIDCAELHRLLSSPSSSTGQKKFHLIDVRFNYEFNGGHIPGAQNLSESEIKSYFFPEDGSVKPGIVVIHCEFSLKRGPTYAAHLRRLDRQKNIYPKIDYPEIYILSGGYCEFFSRYPTICTPQAYVPMDDPSHEVSRDKNMRKFERSRSYAYGDTGGSKTAGTKSLASWSAMVNAGGNARGKRLGNGL